MSDAAKEYMTEEALSDEVMGCSFVHPSGKLNNKSADKARQTSTWITLMLNTEADMEDGAFVIREKDTKKVRNTM